MEWGSGSDQGQPSRGVTRQLRISEEAADELTDAVRWYEQQRPGLGIDFLNSVDRILARIE